MKRARADAKQWCVESLLSFLYVICYRQTYGSLFGDFEVADDEIRQLFLMTVTHGDAVVDLLLPFGCRPVLHTHDLDR